MPTKNPNDPLNEIKEMVKKAKRKIRRKANKSLRRLDKAHGEAVVRLAKARFKKMGGK